MPSVVWKGFASFGLVSFPIKLFAAARAKHLSAHLLHKKDHSRVKEVWYCAEEDKPVERADLVRGYPGPGGGYVVLTDEEVKKIAPPTARSLEIIQFVKSKEVDPIYFESSYYVAPDENVAKPYELFLEALTASSYFAIAKLTMHSREHIVLLRPAESGLMLHTLYYPNELNAGNRVKPKAKPKVVAKELDLAKNLIQQMAGPFQPESFQDTYRENLERLIEEKSKGKKITVVPQPKLAPVTDIMESLKRSLAAVHGKPAKRPSKAAAKRKAA